MIRPGGLQFFVATLGAILVCSPTQAQGNPLPRAKIPNISFSDGSGTSISLHSLQKKAIVVACLSFDCPMSKSYLPVLAQLVRDYEGQGVAFFGICAGEEPDLVGQYARNWELPFPLSADPHFAIVEALGARITPEVFVVDGRDFVLRYRGRIDDGYSQRQKKNPKVTRQDLKEALDAVLGGKEVQAPRTEAIGCPIVRIARDGPSAGKVTYFRDILPILQRHCQTCHRPDSAAPFSLLTSQQALRWAGDIKQYTASRQMPPWKATEGLPLRDARLLTEQEIATLARWVDGGTPLGNPQDAPPPRSFPTGWRLGTPDLILSMDADFELGPTGPDVMQTFVLPSGLVEDKYVTAIEVRPGNSRIVHHAAVFFDVHGEARRLAESPSLAPETGGGKQPDFVRDGFLGGWVPGLINRYPEGTATLLPKRSDIVMSVHYHRNGRLERDRTQIGLYFSHDPSPRPHRTIALAGMFQFIPPGNADFVVQRTIRVTRDCEVHSVWLHMHLLGKSIKVTLTPPSGPPQTIICLPEWTYGWQETYYFQEPMAVRAGSRLAVEAHYDNSSGNIENPNQSPRPVRWGEQTDDEMCFVFFGATADSPGPIPVEAFDERAWNFLQSYRYSSAPLDRAIEGVSELAGRTALLCVGLFMVVCLLIGRQKFSAVVVLNVLLGAVLLVQGVGWLERWLAARAPSDPLDLPGAAPGLVDGPTTLAAVTYGTAALLLAGRMAGARGRIIVGIVALGAVVLIGVSQVYVRTLLPGTVFASLLAGFVFALTGRCVYHKLRYCSTAAPGKVLQSVE
jgi:peroxiredoxin